MFIKISTYISLIYLVILANETHASCQIHLKEQEKKLPIISYTNFDQNENDGWRALSNQGCDNEALSLMDKYIELQESRVRNVYWHKAQNYAYLENRLDAIQAARKSLGLLDESNHLKDWNNYVLGNIAFLEKNRNDLIFRLQELSATKGSLKNTRILSRLLTCFDKTYKEALELLDCRLKE